MTLANLIFIGGILHFGTLIASANVPKVLDWRTSLAGLDRLSRQMIWVHGAFIVLTLVGFGMLAVAFPDELASGTPLARGVCAFIALFWAARLTMQAFVFDPGPLLTTRFLRYGYHGLTAVFTYHVLVFGWAAIR